jgi:beta-glucanase (GH16 family)
MSRKLLLGVVTVIAILSVSAYAEYRLVWSDEFDGTALDLSKWTYDVGDNWANNELQAYTSRPENSYIKDGNLVIVACKESYHEREYTSARIHTAGKGDFLYGKVEARMKLPKGQGMWPAFWMMPTDSEYGRWAASGEIDIMESTNDAGHIGGTIHYGGAPPDNTFSGGRYTQDGVSFADDFHIYTLEWQPYQMRWYIDGKLYSEKTEWHTKGYPFPAPFDKKFHIILNLAVGGNMPGPPDETTIWPQKVYVDWVRVYQTDHKAPKVTIVSPADNANIPSDKDIVIETKIDANNGDVNKVEFYDEYDLIGADTNAPYSINWAAPGGCYKIKVKATDKEGFSHAATVNVTKGAGCPQEPFHGTPSVIPGKIEAEDFDAGPVNVSYWKAAAAGPSWGRSKYRKNTAVDIMSFEGKSFLSRLGSNEWFEYTVDVTKAGTYDIKSWVFGAWRRQREQNPGSFHIEFDGINKTSSLIIPATLEEDRGSGRGQGQGQRPDRALGQRPEQQSQGPSRDSRPGGQVQSLGQGQGRPPGQRPQGQGPGRGRFLNPIEVTAKNIQLPAGKHVMRFFVEQGGFSLDYFEIVPSKLDTDPNTSH